MSQLFIGFSDDVDRLLTRAADWYEVCLKITIKVGISISMESIGSNSELAKRGV